MPTTVSLSFRSGVRTYRSTAVIDAVDADALARYNGPADDRVHALLKGFPDYCVTLSAGIGAKHLEALRRRVGKSVLVTGTAGDGVRRILQAVRGPGEAVGPATPPPEPIAGALNVMEGRSDMAPLWLLPDGRFSLRADDAAEGIAAGPALVAAARWISSRRTVSFECLFPADPFHPEYPVHAARLGQRQATGLLAWLDRCLTAAAVGGDAARSDANQAAQIRSACASVLSHLLATTGRDPSYRAASAEAAGRLFTLADAEGDDSTARPALRAHIIGLLQLRGPALDANGQARVRNLLKSLVRAAPPYDTLVGPWNFAMGSGADFHDGECEILTGTFRFQQITPPVDAPAPPDSWRASAYQVYEAPFKNVHGQPIRIYARVASPENENLEMGNPFFVGILLNRHAQLGSYDLRAVNTRVEQRGYKLMMSSQCAGLTTRFAITRLFPDADVYSSWDSTYFRTEKGEGSKVTASEGLDCFVAILQGMAAGEDHAHLSVRSRRAQWHHPQASADKDFVQFIGPSHPAVIQRFQDVNQDGKADLYDGFMDFDLVSIAEDLRASATPRDPGVSPSQVSGEAANGLNWATGSMNRVVQYSDLWESLPGASELLYVYQSGGFYDHHAAPSGVTPGKLTLDPGRSPSVCRYVPTGASRAEFRAEILFHSHLAHTGKELKRLLVAADAFWRAVDEGYLDTRVGMPTPYAQRCALLLTMAGLLEFPADQNWIDGLWSLGLRMLSFPDLSRSLVRGCITEADHAASNYYGSRRGLKQLMDTLEKGDPVLLAHLKGEDVQVGRAAALVLS